MQKQNQSMHITVKNLLRVGCSTKEIAEKTEKSLSPKHQNMQKI